MKRGNRKAAPEEKEGWKALDYVCLRVKTFKGLYNLKDNLEKKIKPSTINI
jgi:hypothetical protein